MADKDTFISFVRKHGLNPDIITKFEKYESLLLEKNQHFNLISRTTEEEIWTRHFLDSVLITNYLDFYDKTILDFGSGAGFPGIPLKLIYPSTKLFCIESIRKKTLFLRLLVQELELKDVVILQDRIENINEDYNSCFDSILVRAVKMKDEYIKKAFELLRSGGQLILYKSKIDSNEVDKINAIPECQTITEQRIEKDVPEKRAFIIAEKR